MDRTLTGQLAEFAAGEVAASAVAETVTGLSALDWLACGRAGRDEPVARILRAMARNEAGATQAHVLDGQQVPARMAALANGTISHALDYDDTHFAHIGHPSVAAFPAVMAVGEQLDLGLPQVLQAALVGMEVSIRIGLWLGRGHYQAGFHQTATAGAFGAAVGCGRLLGLTAAQMQQVLGAAATRAAGLKAQFGTMGKPYNAGLAAACGVEVAQLVQAGFTANPQAMEGPLGFGGTHAGAGDLDHALAGLGQVWLFEEVSHKFHACCHGLHAALEALRGLDVAAPEIAEITVRTHPRWMMVCNQPAPMTGLGAKFSYGTVLAMLAVGHDTARLDSYSDQICSDPRVQDLRRRVRVEADESVAETATQVTVLRKDGQQLQAEHDLAVPKALTDRIARVRGKAETLFGDAQADTAWTLLQRDMPVRAFCARVMT